MKSERARLISLVIGLIDAPTGILLMVAPELLVKMMMLSQPPLEPVYLRFIGAFVTATGLYYWLPFVSAAARGVEGLTVVWQVTTIVRVLVACFLNAAIAAGLLCPEWLLVAATDACIAIFQALVLRKGIQP